MIYDFMWFVIFDFFWFDDLTGYMSVYYCFRFEVLSVI